MAHPTAEPVLITRPPQKITCVEPTHQNPPHRGYFKHILGAQAPWFYPGAPKGGTSKPPSASMNVRKRWKRHWINFLAFWLVFDFGWFWRARKIDPYLRIPLKIVVFSSNFPILFSDFPSKKSRNSPTSARSAWWPAGSSLPERCTRPGPPFGSG